jgi:ABC-type nitrate/sulfonate/bicarbonate transport system substrate-binding protein
VRRPLRPRRSRLLAPLAAAAAVLSLVACSGGDAAPSGAGTGTAVPSARCARNHAAGRITYLTGYQYQASVTILEAVVAEQLGYFDDVCLDVHLQAGTGQQGAQLTAAGRAQLTDLGSQSEVLSAAAGGVRVTGVATFGHVPISTLLTMPSTTDLKQLEGTRLGAKGELPAPLRAMLVANGVDVAKVQQVQVGFDPSVLPRGQVQSLAGYKSNEPLSLADAGVQVREWNPEDYGVAGSFGQVVANPAFAKAHPTAVQDFLRAVLHAHEHCASDVQGCVALAAKLSGSGYDVAHNVAVWKAEQALVASSTPPGQPVGYLDPAQTAAEERTLTAAGQKTPSTTTGLFDDSYLRAVYDGTTLVWPAR